MTFAENMKRVHSARPPLAVHGVKTQTQTIGGDSFQTNIRAGYLQLERILQRQLPNTGIYRRTADDSEGG